MLIEVIERRSPTTNRKSTVYRLQCETCGTVNEGCKTRYERSVMHFCNNKCRGRYKHDHPETWKVAIDALNSPESKARAIASIKARAARGECKGWTGKRHSDETKRRLSETRIERGIAKGANNGMFGRSHSDKTRSKMSDMKTRAIVEGRFKPYGTNNKKGHYESSKTMKTHFFKSSWEEATMRYLDVSPDVTTWDYECVRIPYVYNDNKRWYVPDFMVTFVGGHRELWEVKPEQFLDTERVKRTTEAGSSYCHSHGMQYVVLTGQALKERGIVV